jgi:holin-like protein
MRKGQMRRIWKCLPGVLLCCGLAVAGEVLADVLHMVVPGAILGLGAYLAWLVWGRGIGWSRPGAALLLRWLGAMIVPALVGLGGYFALLAGALLPLLAILVVSTLVTALVTAVIFRLSGVVE